MADGLNDTTSILDCGTWKIEFKPKMTRGQWMEFGRRVDETGSQCFNEKTREWDKEANIAVLKELLPSFELVE